jgi:hypothetical protein
MNYWLVVTSPANFRLDRESLGFRLQGLPARYRRSVQNMQPGDRIVYYVMGLQKFGATATITGEYVEDSSRLWTDTDEMWPARRPSRPDIVLQDDELVDAVTAQRPGQPRFITNPSRVSIGGPGSAARTRTASWCAVRQFFRED